MRLLVTGSNGLLGSKLLVAMRARPDLVALGASRDPSPADSLADVPYYPLDVTDRAAVDRVFEEAKPDLVVHAAAMTDVDGCERQPGEAWAVNVTGTRHVVDACNRVGARVVHLSSEYVFDGQAGPYSETDAPNPLSVYGKSKLASEETLAACRQGWAVSRTTVVFGYSPSARRNFVLWLLERLTNGDSVRIVADQVGSPTLADNLAEMVLALATRGGQGVYHTVGASRLSRYDFSRLVAEVFGHDPDLVQPITTSELKQPAPRPLRAGLSIDRFQSEFPDVPVLDARAALLRLRAQLADAGQL